MLVDANKDRTRRHLASLPDQSKKAPRDRSLALPAGARLAQLGSFTLLEKSDGNRPILTEALDLLIRSTSLRRIANVSPSTPACLPRRASRNAAAAASKVLGHADAVNQIVRILALAAGQRERLQARKADQVGVPDDLVATPAPPRSAWISVV